MSKASLIYFEARARVEPIRVILEELAIPYEDKSVSFEEWNNMKGDTPFGMLPAYRDGEVEIFQSHAIIRHLARVHDLYGRSEADRVRCDVIEEAISDLGELVGKAPWRPHFERDRTQYVAAELVPALGRLERFLDANPHPDGFWVGDTLTFADLIAFAMLDTTQSMFPEAMFPEAMDSHSSLTDFCARIAKRPRIATYIASGRRPAIIQLGPKGPIYNNEF
jgi:glutathione S-transferase